MDLDPREGDKVTVSTLGALLERVRMGRENIAEVVLSVLVRQLLAEGETLSPEQLSSALLIGSVLSRIKAASLTRERDDPEGMEEALDVKEEVQLLGLIHRQMFAAAAQRLLEGQRPTPFLATIQPASNLPLSREVVGTKYDLVQALAGVVARQGELDTAPEFILFDAPQIDVRIVGRQFVSRVSSGEFRSFRDLTRGLSVPGVIVCFLILLEGLAIGAFDFDDAGELRICLGSATGLGTLSGIVESL